MPKQDYEPPVGLPCQRNCVRAGKDACVHGKHYAPDNGMITEKCVGAYYPQYVLEMGLVTVARKTQPLAAD